MRNASLLSLSILLGGCSLIATFDRSRIGDGGGMDGGVCDPATHQGCAANELCCDQGGAPTCVATGSSQCESCGTMCGATADSCVDRTCQCGSSPACTDPEVCDSSGMCVECVDDPDCTAAGLTQCVGGTCRECDNVDFSGCVGTEPICNPSFTCEGCSDSPNNCRGGLMCDGSTGECGCTNDDQCLASTPTTPICNSGTDICEGCTMDNDCSSAHPALPICNETDGSCNECEIGGTACPANTPICRQVDGIAECTACTADADCTGRAGTTVCAETGGNTGQCVQCDGADMSACSGSVCDPGTNTCVECAGDSDCADTPTTPICNGGTCEACGADSECNAISAGDVCVTMGPRSGACGDCDPTDSACSGMTPICNPTSTMCVGCSSGTQCAALGTNTPICDGNGSCRACMTSDCMGTATPVCNPATGACVECTVLTQDADCTADQVCSTTTFTCVDCNTGANCGGSMADSYMCTGGQCICDMVGGGPQDDCTCGGASCTMGQRCNRATNTCVAP